MGGLRGLDPSPFHQKNESVLFPEPSLYQKGRLSKIEEAWIQDIPGPRPRPPFPFLLLKRDYSEDHSTSKVAFRRTCLLKKW